MPLEFPTKAEQALADWQNKTKTKPLQASVDKFGGELTMRSGMRREFHFPDDTTLVAEGTGKNHKVTAHLP